MATVEKRGKSYRLIAYFGYDTAGNQLRKTKTIPAAGITKKEAERLASNFEDELLGKSFFNDKNLTLSGFIDYWKKEYALQEDTYSPKTLERNEGLLKRIIPVLGHIRLKKLKPTHIMQFYNNLREDDIRLNNKKEPDGKLSSRTVQMHHKLLLSILNKAKQWQFLEVNPCQHVDAPKAKCKKTPIWNEETLIRFFSLLFAEAKLKYILFFMIAFSTGIRRGENLALRISSFDREKGKLQVKETAIVVKGGVIFKEPKTEKSESGVSVSASIFQILDLFLAEREMLRKNSAERGTPWPETDLLFTTSEGHPMFPSTIAHWLKAFLTKHNLPMISTRSFRNMSITYAIDRGFDLKAVSERARHAQLSTTTDIYAHVLPQKDQAIAASLDEIIKLAQPKEEVEFYGDYI